MRPFLAVENLNLVNFKFIIPYIKIYNLKLIRNIFIIFIANLFDGIKIIGANMEEESEAFRNEFKQFIQKVAAYSRSKQDQEEKMILR